LSTVLNPKTTPKIFYWGFLQIQLRVPVFLNLKRLEILKEQLPNFKYYIISSRQGGKRFIEQKLVDYGYDVLFYEIIAPRKQSKLVCADFKEKVCKQLGIEWFFEDNRYTVNYLREKGIKAIKL